MLEAEARKHSFIVHVPKNNAILPFSEWKDSKEQPSDSKVGGGTECQAIEAMGGPISRLG